MEQREELMCVPCRHLAPCLPSAWCLGIREYFSANELPRSQFLSFAQSAGSYAPSMYSSYLRDC